VSRPSLLDRLRRTAAAPAPEEPSLSDPTPAPIPPVVRIGKAPVYLGSAFLLVFLWVATYLMTDKPPARSEGSPPAPLQPSASQALVEDFLASAVRAQKDSERQRQLQDALAEAERRKSEEALAGAEPSPEWSSPPAQPQRSYEPRPTSQPISPSRHALDEAMEADPFVSLSRPLTSPSQVPAAAAGGASLEDSLRELAGLAASLGAATPGAASSQGTSPTPLVQRRDPDRTAFPLEPRPTLSPFTLAAGSLIPATLASTVVSDLPGTVTAVVRQNVYDTPSGSNLLIPAGSRLVGTYDSSITHGQNRLLLSWNRLILPNGATFNLPDLPAADLAGASGLKDRTNRHLAKAFSTAFLLSGVTAAAQLSQPDSYSGILRNPTAQEVATGALGQRVNETATALLERDHRTAPTLTLRAGTPCNVVLSTDILFPGAYVER
jgi:type IV secretory pathway VirB10-like protein